MIPVSVRLIELNSGVPVTSANDESSGFEESSSLLGDFVTVIL